MWTFINVQMIKFILFLLSQITVFSDSVACLECLPIQIVTDDSQPTGISTIHRLIIAWPTKKLRFVFNFLPKRCFHHEIHPQNQKNHPNTKNINPQRPLQPPQNQQQIQTPPKIVTTSQPLETEEAPDHHDAPFIVEANDANVVDFVIKSPVPAILNCYAE